MAPFAGYDMPIQYPTGILAEHLHTRAAAGLFDVSHMGQAWLDGPDHETTARALEALCPADLVGLAPGPPALQPVPQRRGRRRSTTSWSRGRAAPTGGSSLVVNAARKAVDYALAAASGCRRTSS